MAERNRDWASSFGSAVRLLWLIFCRFLFVGGFALVVVGVGEFDRRIATILAGLIVVGLMWPRPDRRK